MWYESSHGDYRILHIRVRVRVRGRSSARVGLLRYRRLQGSDLCIVFHSLRLKLLSIMIRVRVTVRVRAIVGEGYKTVVLAELVPFA